MQTFSGRINRGQRLLHDLVFIGFNPAVFRMNHLQALACQTRFTKTTQGVAFFQAFLLCFTEIKKA